MRAPSASMRSRSGSGASSRPLIVFGGSFHTSLNHSRKTSSPARAAGSAGNSGRSGKPPPGGARIPRRSPPPPAVVDAPGQEPLAAHRLDRTAVGVVDHHRLDLESLVGQRDGD